MKIVLFTAALMLSGAALAQTQPDTTTPDTTVPDTTAPDTTMPDATTTTVPTVATMPAMPATGATVAPGNVAPKRDARGIPVISAPAMAPPGVNEPIVVPPGVVAVPNPNQAAAFQTQTAAADYPPCTRTVTDHCVQTYERRHPASR